MPTGDPSKPGKPNVKPETPATGASSSRTASPQPAGQTPPESTPDSVDFGSYVSSTVRSSAELFGTPARSAPKRSQPSQQKPATPPARASDRYVPPSEEIEASESEPQSPRASRDRSNRYWRDSVSPGSGAEPEIPSDTDGDGGGGRFGGGFLSSMFPNGERPSNNVIIGTVALALLAIIALVWFLNRDSDGGQELTPTPTSETVFDAEASATEVDDPSTPTGFVPPRQSPATPTPTEGPRRGGDNVRDQESTDSTPDASNTGDPLANIELGPVAQQCPERCLVRVTNVDNMDELMTIAGTRPSFSGNEWQWVIASTEGIAYFEQHTDTTLVSKSADTLSLYMATLPDGESSDDQVQAFGDVLDSAGQFRMVEAESAPANVKGLTDWGIQVDKVAPAPPLEIALQEEPTALSSIEIGSLIDDVAGNNIEQTILDLQGMGSSDGTGIGSRYYTTVGNSQAAEYLFLRLESYGLKVWYEDFLSWEGYLMVNVIGEIPGEDTSAIYGVMAHFDTIAPNINTSPGADDNATGLSASLEIARILSAYELHHPLRVIFVNVEEVGIVGSEQFAERAKTEGTPYEGIFNLDSVGAARQYSYLVINGNGNTSWMSDLYIRLNDAYGLGQAINSQQNQAIVADDNRLRDNGIDSIMVARELYGQSPYHHTGEDKIDTLSIDGVVSCAQLTLLSLAELAQA